jgi:hypothetical protein
MLLIFSKVHIFKVKKLKVLEHSKFKLMKLASVSLKLNRFKTFAKPF